MLVDDQELGVQVSVRWITKMFLDVDKSGCCGSGRWRGRWRCKLGREINSAMRCSL